MTDRRLARRNLLLTAFAGLTLSACDQPATPAATSPARAAPAPAQPDGRLTITRHQVAFMGNVAWGGGTLSFQDRTFAFRLRGLGAGGAGISRLDATGEVFNLARIEDFAGVYGQIRTGVVAGDTQLGAAVWLQNTNGVRIRLQPRRRGLALQFGADGILVELRPQPAPGATR